MAAPDITPGDASAANAAPEKAGLRAPHLSKSRYLTGLQCERRLWLGWHDPEPAAEAGPGSIFAVGHEVGALAHALFPGGVLVGGGPAEFQQAVNETRARLGDASVSAIFEAAFVFANVRVRADIIERLDDGSWALYEVKSSTRVKAENLDDMTVQTFVIEGCGLKIRTVTLVHIDTSYVREGSAVEPSLLFARADRTSEVRARLPEVQARIAAMLNVLAQTSAPERRPSAHCFSPYDCEFWSRCTKAKPADWIFYLPRLRPAQFEALEALNIESIREIPDDFVLTGQQRRVVDAWRGGGLNVRPGLEAALPAYEQCGYLDFETLSPALPLYQHSRPYQRQAAQWSLHRRSGGTLQHAEFLGELTSDPARPFADSLLAAVSFNGPVFVYSSFEGAVLGELALKLPDLAADLQALKSRLVDLLPIVRAYLDHPQFYGSHSIKTVAPVLAPDVDYTELDGVADGGAASEALYRIATGQLLAGESRETLRRQLLDYCRLDTLALARVHEALTNLAATDDGDGQTNE